MSLKYFRSILWTNSYCDLACKHTVIKLDSNSGLNGSKGGKGEVGVAGPQGLPGSKGYRGNPGYPGRKGSVGVPGDVGQEGSKGHKGKSTSLHNCSFISITSLLAIEDETFNAREL